MQAIADRLRAVAADRPQGTALRIVPILGESRFEPPYQTLGAKTLDRIRISELGEGGVVSILKVENLLDERVFLMDGQGLVGAKQNRILNTDVLVPSAKAIHIPVSCVEQGRWRKTTRFFSMAKAASYRTRAQKLGRIHASLREGRGHDADQGAVWREVAASLAGARAESPTMALHTAYDLREQDLSALRKSFQLPENAIGLAVFLDNAFQGLDLFDRHSTLQAVWESILDSYAIEHVGRGLGADETQSGGEDALTPILKQIAEGTWQRFDSPGDGADYRFESERLSGSALVWDDRTVIHLQVFPRNEALESRLGGPLHPHA